MGLYVFNKHTFPAFIATLREFHLVTCCLFTLPPQKKPCWNRSVFRSFFGFRDIFSSKSVLKWSKKGEKRRKNVIKLHKFEHFSLCKILAISRNKNNSKKVKKSLQKSWRERKKSYLCTRKTTGTRGWEKREVVERSSLKEWSKQSLKGKCRKTLSILKINPSQDRKQEKRDTNLQRRVWSWLRMNASGRPNTCKSNGKWPFGAMRVAHGCVTRMQPTQCWRIARRNPD